MRIIIPVTQILSTFHSKIGKDFYAFFIRRCLEKYLDQNSCSMYLRALFDFLSKGLEDIKDGNPKKAILAGFGITTWAACLISSPLCSSPGILISLSLHVLAWI